MLCLRGLIAPVVVAIGLCTPAVADVAQRGPIGTIAAADLPPEGRETLALIRKGGPFPYTGKDGSVFANRERVLPVQQRGYYREYTVKTPGVRNRGARRIVCGGEKQRECFYTADHYASFKRIAEY